MAYLRLINGSDKVQPTMKMLSDTYMYKQLL